MKRKKKELKKWIESSKDGSEIKENFFLCNGQQKTEHMYLYNVCYVRDIQASSSYVGAYKHTRHALPTQNITN